MSIYVPIPQLGGPHSFGVPAACRLGNVPRLSVDWTNDQERLLEEIERIGKLIEEGVQWLLDRVEQLFSPILMPVRQIGGPYLNNYIVSIRHEIDRKIEIIRRDWAALRPGLEKAARCAGNPAALGQMAHAWRTYNERLSALADAVTLEKLVTDDHWVGDAATAYSTSAQNQQIALSNLAHATEIVGNTLEDHGAAIFAYQLLIDDAMAGFSWSFGIATGGAVISTIGLAAGGVPGVVLFIATILITAASLIAALALFVSGVNTANALFDSSATSQKEDLDRSSLATRVDWPTFVRN